MRLFLSSTIKGMVPCIPPEMWLQVISSSKTHELARLVVCSKLFGPLVLYELQRRATERGHIHDKPVPRGFGTKLAHLVWLEWLHDAETPFYPLMQQDAKNDAWQALGELTPRELEQYTGVIAFELVSRFRNNQLMLSLTRSVEEHGDGDVSAADSEDAGATALDTADCHPVPKGSRICVIPLCCKRSSWGPINGARGSACFCSQHGKEHGW